MRDRSIIKFIPGLERFEPKQLLSAGSSSTILAHTNDNSSSTTIHSIAADVDAGNSHNAAADASTRDRAKPAPANPHGYLLFRVTNTPYQTPYALIPPFQQVLVQSKKPKAGEVYNVCDVAVKNGTSQTFTATNNFTVRLTNQPRSFGGFPVLTGNEEWKPGQIMVFYVLTKKYYPVSFVAGGFQFNLGGRSSTAVPGPAGIFLRLKYDPTTFSRTLNWIVAYGQGNETGNGAALGLPNTSINEVVSARTQRHDFAGHF